MSKLDAKGSRGRPPAFALAQGLALLAALLFAVPSEATYDPLSSGSVEIRLDGKFNAFLRSNGVKVRAAKPAKVRPGAIILPIDGGHLDPTVGKGVVTTAGSFAFEADGKKIPFRQVTVKAKHSPLIAKIGGGQLKVASSNKLSTGRYGFGTQVSAAQLKLSAKVAERLNKKLRPASPFVAGQVIGSILARGNPETVTILPQGAANIVFSDEFLAKLNGLFVAVNPIFPAEHQGASFSVPILSGGAVSPDLTLGTLKTGGSIEFLQLPSNSQVFWHEFWFEIAAASANPELDAEPSPPLPGKVGRTASLQVGAGLVAADPAARTISDSDAALALTAETATLFNQAFAQGKGVFEPGDSVGVLSFSAQGQ